jgi:hypothetical protein
VLEPRGLATGGHQIGPGTEALVGLYLLNHCTQAPTEPVPLHGATCAASDGISDARAIPVVVQVHDRDGATAGALSGPPKCLERCPVGYTPGHAEIRLATQAVSLWRPLSLRARTIALPARVDIRCLKP